MKKRKDYQREIENLPDPNTIQVLNGGLGRCIDRVILSLCSGNTLYNLIKKSKRINNDKIKTKVSIFKKRNGKWGKF